MTTRKLTPAEALECLRDRRAVDRAELSSTMFYDRWGTFDHAVWSAIAALEEAMAETERLREELGQANMRLASWPHNQSNAAPVPSDEEIVGWLELCRTSDNLQPAVWMTLMHLARRIGVQGVPQ